MHKYDVRNCDLNPSKGHTQAGFRPCIIIQNNTLNERGSTTILIPITSNIKDIYEIDLLIHPSELNGLKSKSKAICNHIITLDKRWCIAKVGELDIQYRNALQEKVDIVLDRENWY